MMRLRVRWAAMTLVIAAAAACTGAPPDPNASRKLTDDVSISGQITIARVKALQEKGFKTIVNMQPDDEAPDQAKYKQMQSAVQDAKLGYGYVPVKKGPAIPGTAAEALGTVLKRMPKPILIYGDTPEHPAKVWALAEASRAGGLEKAAILGAVKSAGVPADDLASQIDARIAARPKH